MSFHPEKVDAFLENFHKNKEHIRNFKGNTFLELYQDKSNKSVFFTYSIWESEEDLENYRNSELFTEVWTFTKALFNDKPQAWSVDKISPPNPPEGRAL